MKKEAVRKGRLFCLLLVSVRFGYSYLLHTLRLEQVAHHFGLVFLDVFSPSDSLE